MNTLCLFDLCPDIEELIVDELKVLTKYRKAVKEFKLRIKLGHKSLTRNYKKSNTRTYFGSTGKPVYGTPRNLIHTLFPDYGKHDNKYGKYHEDRGAMQLCEYADIHGYKYDAFANRLYESHWTVYCATKPVKEMNVQTLNETLTELGAKRFKSKKKYDKIKLLMKY